MADYAAIENECLRYAKAPIEQAVTATESTFNPFAIGVVNGRLVRQPRNRDEAVATALSLKAQGYNYSMGCRQVNQSNLAKYGLDHVSVFDPLKNSLVGRAIYDECHGRAVAKFGDGVAATKAALSCYYSGNFTRGQQKEGNSISYVDKVLGKLSAAVSGKETRAIPVVVIKAPTVRRRPELKAAGQGAAEPALAQQTATTAASWDVFKEF